MSKSDDLEWTELRREPVADCRIFSVERSVAASPRDGSTHTFFRIASPDWVQIVPVTADEQVVLVRQYRHGAERVTLEIPAGLIELGEAPADAALRECLEETGYRGTVATPLAVINPNPALFGNRLFSFVAENVVPLQAIQNTGTEETRVVLVPIAGLPQRLASGEIDHALCAVTLWHFLYRRGVL